MIRDRFAVLLLMGLCLGSSVPAQQVIRIRPEHRVPLSPVSAQEAIQISPDQASMLEGESRSFQVLGCNGEVMTGASWDANGDVVRVKDGNQVEVTALNAGETTLYATLNGVTVSAKITVFAGRELPVGTVHWAVPPLGDCSNRKAIQKPTGTFLGGRVLNVCHLIKKGMKRSEVDQLTKERGILLIGENLNWRFHEANYSCEMRFAAVDGVVETKSIKVDSETD
jgi:hypothetical protein